MNTMLHRNLCVLAVVVLQLIYVSPADFTHANAIAWQTSSEDTSAIWDEVQKALSRNDLQAAENGLSKILKADPNDSLAFYYRGRVRFQSGQVKKAVADFDKHVKLSPSRKSRQWERGIALYYAGKFREGAEQFALYQTYHDNDVENSAWRFLCVARSKSIKKARQNLLPIRNDTRIPMMEIYKMYQGKLSADEVLKAVDERAKGKAERNAALFYAHLYIGLLREVEGKTDAALKHAKLARQHRIGHYMWDVANVHVQLRDANQKKAAE